MSTVAISFTSESGDRYLSLLTDVHSPEHAAELVAEEYDEEFAYLYIDCVVTDNETEQEVVMAVQALIEEAQDE